jgi:hypothetical protein
MRFGKKMIETLYFLGGIIVGSGLSYLWFRIGRVVEYQDRNIIPPPHPISVPSLIITPKKETNPPGWIDDHSEPSMAEFHKQREL